MDVAVTIAQLGTCDRKQVGAVIIRNGRCISWGYNGAPPGLPHCSENGHGYLNSEVGGSYEGHHIHDEWLDQKLADSGCRNATHAELNALAFAARQGISTDSAELFVTLSPCDTCARALIAAGISRIYYREEYRDRSGIELLQGASIESIQLG